MTQVYFYTTLVHTPLVPFGVSLLKASAGVMVTASHNPARDNGYKVYWANGCQIIPPHDKAIAAAIQQNLEPTCWDAGLVDRPPSPQLVERPLEKVREAYFERLKRINNTPAAGHVRFVYTPMHGVGLPFMKRAMEDLGVAEDMVVVKEQVRPPPQPPAGPAAMG